MVTDIVRESNVPEYFWDNNWDTVVVNVIVDNNFEFA